MYLDKLERGTKLGTGSRASGHCIVCLHDTTRVPAEPDFKRHRKGDEDATPSPQKKLRTGILKERPEAIDCKHSSSLRGTTFEYNDRGFVLSLCGDTLPEYFVSHVTSRVQFVAEKHGFGDYGDTCQAIYQAMIS